MRVAASYQKMLPIGGLALVLTLPCSVFAGPVDAEPPNLAAGVTQLGDAIRELAADVRAKDLLVALPALQQLQLAVQNFKVHNIGELSRPFQKAGKNARAGYLQLAALLNRTELQAQDSESWRRMGRDIEAIRSLLSDGGDGPAVIAYSPVAVSPGQSSVSMIVRGQKLDQGDAAVEAGGIALVPRANDNGELTFSVPGAAFAGIPGGVGTSEVLVTSSRTKRPLLIPGVFTGKQLTGFELLVFVLPERAATYLVTAKAPGVGRETREVRSNPITAYSQDAITSSQSCEPIVPSEGWLVDTTIPPQWSELDNQNAAFDGIQQLNEGGFCLQFTIRGQGVARGRGLISGQVTYTEYRASAEPGGGEVARGDLAWEDRTIVPLPPRTESFEVQLVFFDGSQAFYSDVGRSGPVRIERDLASNGLSISIARPGF